MISFAAGIIAIAVSLFLIVVLVGLCIETPALFFLILAILFVMFVAFCHKLGEGVKFK